VDKNVQLLVAKVSVGHSMWKVTQKSFKWQNSLVLIEMPVQSYATQYANGITAFQVEHC